MNEILLRRLIRQQLTEVYGSDVGTEDIDAMTMAVWETLDVDQLVGRIVQRCVNAYNGSRNANEAEGRMEQAVSKALEEQASQIASAVVNAVGIR